MASPSNNNSPSATSPNASSISTDRDNNYVSSSTNASNVLLDNNNNNNTLTKLDISLLAGVATWGVPAPNINIKWIAKQKNFREPFSRDDDNQDNNNNINNNVEMRTCADMMSWSSIDPVSELEVRGIELIRSPRSALAVLRHGVRVRDLCDSDVHKIHADSRKAKLSNQETAKRIELDRQRRDQLRSDVAETYQQICANFTRQDLISAIRTFLFKGEEPDPQRRKNLNGDSNHSVTPEKQQNNLSNIDSSNNKRNSRPHSALDLTSSSSQRPRQDAFSRLTCSPASEGRNLLRPEEIDDIVMLRDKEASRLRRRLFIDANHKANRIVQELERVETLDTENDAADQGQERALQLMIARQREVAQRNVEKEERAKARKEELRLQDEDRMRNLEMDAEDHEWRVSSFISDREKRAQAAKMVSVRSESKSRTSLTPTPNKLAMMMKMPQNKPFMHNNKHNSNFETSTSSSFCKKYNTNDPLLANEIDDLMTEWKVQNLKTQKLAKAHQGGQKREDAQFNAQQRRARQQKQQEVTRHTTAKKEEERCDVVAVNRNKIESRVSRSHGLLAARIDHAKQYAYDKDVERGERFNFDHAERMERSKNLLDSQAQERRQKFIDKLFHDDAVNEWRDQRNARQGSMTDAKRVIFNANLEDIEEDAERRRVAQGQLSRENHLLRKTNLAAFHDLAEEEKKILVELNLRNAIAP